MSVSILLACVDYADFLRLTLPRAVAAADYVLVVTAPRDTATQALCRQHGADCLPTDIWWADGAPFAKAAALNLGLERLAQRKVEWLLSLDADILLPRDACQALHQVLNPSFLYGARRRICPAVDVWNQFVATQDLQLLPMGELPPVRKTKRGPRVWGSRPTANPVGLQGYFQLWYQRRHNRRFQGGPTAAGCDVALGLTWPDERRHLLPNDMCVIHLGESRTNWKGRVTQRWDTAKLPLPA